MIIALILLIFVSTSALGQLVDSYKIEVNYQYGKDTITVYNHDKIPYLPAPTLKSGSIYYDGEYLLNKVKSFKVIEINHRETNDKGVMMRKFTYWHTKYQKFVTVDVISSPKWEAEQRAIEAEARKTSIFPTNNK